MINIYRSFDAPNREGLTWEEIWHSSDRGLIKSYEMGRKLARNKPELAERAKNGELPATGYKGGTDKAIKKMEKVGSLNYLAEWQALRGESLNIDLDKEVVLTCSRTGVRVLFTGNIEKLKNSF